MLAGDRAGRWRLPSLSLCFRFAPDGPRHTPSGLLSSQVKHNQGLSCPQAPSTCQALSKTHGSATAYQVLLRWPLPRSPAFPSASLTAARSVPGILAFFLLSSSPTSHSLSCCLLCGRLSPWRLEVPLRCKLHEGRDLTLFGAMFPGPRTGLHMSYVPSQHYIDQ